MFCSRLCSAKSRTQPFADRVKRYTVVDPVTGCWVWMANRGLKGYGYTCDNGKTRTAHRTSYDTFVGPIPEGMHVLHRCDNPPCVNPEHLFLGSNTDNNNDKVAKGRARGAMGERNTKAKLTWAQVEAIRADPRSQSTIGRAYGVTQSAVSAIKRGATWKRSTSGSGLQDI